MRKFAIQFAIAVAASVTAGIIASKVLKANLVDKAGN
jgi:hypothetical protein